MKPIDLYLVLTGYTFTVTIAAIAEYLLRRRLRYAVPALVALLALAVNTIAGSMIDAERSYLQIVKYLIAERDTSSLAALGMGFAAGYAWLARCSVRAEEANVTVWTRIQPTVLAISILIFVGCGEAFLWKSVTGYERHLVTVASPKFTIETVAVFDDDPLRIAAGDNGDVYVCYDYFKKHGAWGGIILRYRENPATGEFERKTVAESPILARCYGLVFKDGDLYVSRSGFHPQTNMGRVTYEATGAITQLRDLDGDDYFEFAHDIITGLPGVRAPDTMQQNNGFLFDSDGSLYVTNASAADRTLDEHPWGGTILHYDANFQHPEVFASGFRNPWTIAFGPDGELFATDNDVDSNPGDELNHLIKGEHYGHPFVIPGERGVEAKGFRQPILVAERESVLLGLAYITNESWPPEFRDCLYVTDFRRSRILRLKLQRDGDTYVVSENSPFASIPTPVDMTVTPSGDLYVISRRAKKMFRIRPTH